MKCNNKAKEKKERTAVNLQIEMNMKKINCLEEWGRKELLESANNASMFFIPSRLFKPNYLRKETFRLY